MKIVAKNLGPLPAPVQHHSRVDVTVEFDGPDEPFTMSVIVTNSGTDDEIRDRAIRHAQVLARSFADSLAKP